MAVLSFTDIRYTMPEVSILVPVYNRARIILDTLSSAVNQTYKHIEVIVVDNRSTDNTFEIVKKFAELYPNVKVYQNKENIGPVRNWRRCLEYATGKYAKILWSDDLIAPDFIEKTLPYLEEHEDVGFVFTGAVEFENEKDIIARWHFIGDSGVYDSNDFIEGHLLVNKDLPNSPGCALFRRHDIEKNLIVDIPNKNNVDFASLAIGNDVLIYLLTAKDYHRFAFVNEPGAFFRSHRGSITRTSKQVDLTLFYLMAKAYFVENYVGDEELKGRFNAVILHNLKGNSVGIKNIEDFYYDRKNSFVSYRFFVKICLKRILHKVLQGK